MKEGYGVRDRYNTAAGARRRGPITGERTRSRLTDESIADQLRALEAEVTRGRRFTAEETGDYAEDKIGQASLAMA
jgi:hypothetical protein